MLHKLIRKPTAESTSLDLECVILSHDHRRAAARCVEDIVVYDYKRARKTAVPGFMGEVLGRYFERQEETRRRTVGEILEMRRSFE